MKTLKISYQKDGKDLAVIVKKPSHTELTEANLYAAGVFNRARKTGVCLRSQIDDWLEEQGIWTKKDRELIIKLEDELNKKLELLNSGKKEDGTNMKLSEARKLAIEIRTDRWRLNLLQLKRREWDGYTVEGQTDDARFDYLVSMCLLDEEGSRLFKSIDEYYDLADEKYINEAASKLANMLFGTEDWQMKLEENIFLKKHNLIDENLALIDKQGRHINSNGELIVDEDKVEKEEVKFEDDLS